VRSHPVRVAAVAAAELHICPVVVAGADMGKPELAHIVVEVAVAAPGAGNQ